MRNVVNSETAMFFFSLLQVQKWQEGAYLPTRVKSVVFFIA